MLEFNFTPFPALETERLVLRQLTEKDAESYHFLLSDDDVMRYMDAPKCENVEIAAGKIIDINKGVVDNQSIVWGVSLKNEDVLIGSIGFWKTIPYHHRAEIGYRLHPSFWKKGLMTEALREVLRYGFETMQLHSIEANVSPENEASKQLLTNQGFNLEAHFRENYYFEGKFLDSYIYSLLKKDFHL